ncbi:MAG: DUF3592 domain-containing protein, partial [Candidatus Staskawiczbacteria bacterium]|nr:DUF3592 domain-containing protein [Candidatus Staskawiczbacteria bacterium]
LFFVKSFIWSGNTLIAQGTIVDYKTVQSGSSFSLCPVVRFKDNSGKEITFNSSVCEGKASLNSLLRYFSAKNGYKVTLRYNPKNPQDAKINSIINLYFPVFLFGLFTLVFLGYYYGKDRVKPK